MCHGPDENGTGAEAFQTLVVPGSIWLDGRDSVPTRDYFNASPGRRTQHDRR